jgi:hypothetical protein
MKRWCGWGECLINIRSPEFKGRGDRHALCGAGIGTHEAVAGHLGSGRAAVAGREVGAGGGGE